MTQPAAGAPFSRRALLREALALAGPIAGAYLAVVCGLLVEFLVVGNALGGDGLAAMGLAATLSLVLVLSFHALEIAAQAIIARRYGEGRHDAAGAVLDNALALSFALGVPLAAALYFVGPLLFQSSSDTINALAADYFRWRLVSVPFLIAVLSIIGFFNAVGRPRVPALIYALILVLNGVLCWALVGGRLGLPELGIRGAGLSQVISTMVGFGAFMVLLGRRYYREHFGCLHPRRHLGWPAMRALLVIAGPVFVQQFLGNFGFYLFMTINGMVDDDGVSLAAATIARQVGYLSYLPSLGFGLAAATMVGHGLGAGDAARARAAALACWGLGLTLMMTLAAGFVVFRHRLVGMFLANGAPHAEAVASMAATLLLIVAAYQFFESMNTILGKALQGAGETMFVMKASVAFQWAFFLPLAWLLALPMGWGAVGALGAFAVQLVLVGLLFLRTFLRGGWEHRRV